MTTRKVAGNRRGYAKPVLLAATACLTLSGASLAAQGDRTGGQVVEQVCAKCHAHGVDGAPRIGDAKAWALREKSGLSGLTRHALEGIRKMPPHGGNPDLSDLEIKRAITYMVDHSGGNWVEPIDRRVLPPARSAQQIVEAQCVKCHGTGVNGAPRIGDKDAWIQRLKFGLESAVRSAIHGHGGMPARGGMADLTDDELRAAVTYMFQKSIPPPQ